MEGIKGIRLFSCSDWQAGSPLAKYIDKDLPVYTSNRKVDLYFDENKELISIDGGQWKKSTKTEESIVNPDWDKGPQAKGTVVQMSDFPPKVQQRIQGFNSEELTAFKKDYKNQDFKNAINGKPELVDSWKVLREANLGDDIAKDITSLTKARRYMDNGLTIEPGGVVKQADGTVIGKLDNTDVYNPGELKVKGEHSGRHFDPDDAGGAIVKKDWNAATIDQSGIDDVTTHLSRFEDIDGDNAFMIDRLNKIKNGEIPATDYDKRFYTHELEEYSRYKNKGIADGVNDEDFYYNAHTASLEAYSINEIQSPLYHPK